MSSNPFESARGVSAADVARREGLSLRQRGPRQWACCPLHGERTASLCFYPDGRWYCFGCHAHGDAVDLYAALHQVAPVEAARALAGESALPRKPLVKRAAPPPYLAGADEDGFTWGQLCDVLHRANAVTVEEGADTPRLWAAVAARAEAEIRLENQLAGEGGG